MAFYLGLGGTTPEDIFRQEPAEDTLEDFLERVGPSYETATSDTEIANMGIVPIIHTGGFPGLDGYYVPELSPEQLVAFLNWLIHRHVLEG
jgi:hypothetical protein